MRHNAWRPVRLPFCQNNRLLEAAVTGRGLLNVEWSEEVSGAQAAGQGRTAVSTRDPFTGTLIAPPPEEIGALHHLARFGDTRDVVQHATHVTELVERCRPFGDHLCRPAKNYRSKAILSFVEQYLKRRQAQ